MKGTRSSSGRALAALSGLATAVVVWAIAGVFRRRAIPVVGAHAQALADQEDLTRLDSDKG